MHPARKLMVIAALLAALVHASREASAIGVLSAGATSDNSTITFQWTFSEDPNNPVGHPEWTGYDVYRRALPGCAAGTRVNATPFPRTPGVTESFTYLEAAPSLQTTFDYQVVPVDSARNPLTFSPAECQCGGPMSHGWASCPPNSAPLSQGTLTDLGWAIYLMNPCPGSCYGLFYVSQPEMIQQLRPYAGTGAVVRLWGTAGCGDIEGCGASLDHWDLAACPSTAVRTTSWGRLKVIHR